jgi:prenyltransferase beta subunit
MGLKAILLALLAGISPASYVASHQQPDGGFAERGGKSYLDLTAWSVLGLVAYGQRPGVEAQLYLQRAPAQDVSDTELRILALEAVGGNTDGYDLPVDKSGRIGPLVDSTIWGILALRSAGRPVPATSVRYLLGQQRPSGGWSWYPRGAPDSNDTAAAIEALRSVGVKGKPIGRALSYLRRLEGKDGGFALVRGRASDSQSTAWAIQAFLAAGKKPPAAAFRFLARMRRPDGSYRYSKRYSVTPVWVTSQVLPALARKPFPLG